MAWLQSSVLLFLAISMMSAIQPIAKFLTMGMMSGNMMCRLGWGIRFVQATAAGCIPLIIQGAHIARLCATHMKALAF